MKSARTSTTAHWLILGALAGAVSAFAACSSKFSSCEDTRTCAQANGGEAGVAGEGGASGSEAAAGQGADGGASFGASGTGGSNAEAGDDGGGQSNGGSGAEGGSAPTACGLPEAPCCSSGDQCVAGAACAGSLCACAAMRAACGGSCVDLEADPKNCGACGHDCLGATCTLGACDALELARDQGTLITVVVDSQYIYWGGDGAAIGKRRLDGTGQTTILVGKGAKEYSYWSALAGQTLYWGNDWHDMGLRSCALPSCDGGPTTSVGGASNTLALTSDYESSTLFWGQPDGIWHKVLPDGVAENLVPRSSTYILDIKTDRTFLYWTEYDSTAKLAAIYKRPFGSSTITTLVVNRPLIRRLSVKNNVLYFLEELSDHSDVRSLPLPNGVGSAVPTLFAAAGGLAADMMASSSGVYWTTYGAGPNSVSSCPLTGCASTPTIVSPATMPSGITADAQAIYWVQGDGRVMKIAK